MTHINTLPCAQMFGQVAGDEIIELIERTTGEQCPCKQGRRCPLLPAVGAVDGKISA